MTQDEGQQAAARLFSTIRDMLAGFPDEVRFYAIINLTSIMVLDRCVGKSGEDLVRDLEFVFAEVTRAIIANRQDDKTIPTVEAILNRTKSQ